jgi:hypothetical protein
MTKNKTILLIEDNPDDERLTLMGFKKNGIVNDIIITRDGVEAVDFNGFTEAIKHLGMFWLLLNEATKSMQEIYN